MYDRRNQAPLPPPSPGPLYGPAQEVENFAQIKVIGVGGGGSNAVNRMIRAEVKGVEFIAVNTDAQALLHSDAPTRIRIGDKLTKGLGSGGNPTVGGKAAEESSDELFDVLRGADMVFITAGMGGGTGTGAAPVVAEVAKELGILTVAVVTKPFLFEGKRVRAANTGIEALARHVDSLIIIPNEKLMQVLGDDVSMLDAFKAANNVLHGAVGGIAEVINCPGLVNVDFADVRTVMSEMGMAMMGSAQASGENRARIAAEQAVASPLLEDVNLAGARGVLVNITASSTVKMKEIHEVMNTIKGFTAEEATVIVGQVLDDTMEDALRVTMVATGLGNPVARQNQKPMQIIRTGTDDVPMMVNGNSEELPSVMTSRRSRTIQAMTDSGIDTLDIPAFLRRQAD